MLKIEAAREEMFSFFSNTLNEAATEAVMLQEFYNPSHAQNIANGLTEKMMRDIRSKSADICVVASFKQSSNIELNELKNRIHQTTLQTIMGHYADSYAALTGGKQ